MPPCFASLLCTTPRAGPTIKLEGKLFGPWIEEIVRVVAAGTISGVHPRLDLSEVSNVDPAGIVMLRNLIASRVTLVGCSEIYRSPAGPRKTARAEHLTVHNAQRGLT